MNSQSAATVPAFAHRAAIYARISKDAEGSGLGVARQEKECRALAERRGWLVVDVLVDNDIGASTYVRKTRPSFERLLTGVEAGDFDVVVCWDLDRLTRRPLEAENLWSRLMQVGDVRVATVSGDDINLGTGEGLMVARIKAAVAAEEVSKLSRRLCAKMRQLAESGEVGGGGVRAFGYEDDRKTPRASEADLIREAAARVLAGDTLSRITAEWTERGVQTVTGAPWSTTNLRNILCRGRVAGLREHRGSIVGAAVWPAIIDHDTWERVRIILLDPARARGGRPRTYLLTGIARCGVCGHTLVGTPRQRRSGGGKRGMRVVEPGPSQRAYGCVKATGGCGGIYIVAEALEDFVSDATRHRLRGGRLERARERLDRRSKEADALAEASEAEEFLTRLGQDYAANLVTRASFLAAQEAARERIDAARRRLAAERRPTALEAIADIDQAWPGLSVERRRAILSAVLAYVVVGKAMGVRNRFDPSRVTLEWRF